MKKIVMGLMFCIFCGMSQGSTEGQQLASGQDLDLFDEFSEFEAPDIDLVVVRRKPKITLKEVPFYCKLLYSYLYEEKVRVWYQSLVGYFFASKVKGHTKMLKKCAFPVKNKGN